MTEVKLTKGQRVFLQIARDLGGSCHVFRDQWGTASALAAKGLINCEGYFDRIAELTDAGRTALASAEGHRDD